MADAPAAPAAPQPPDDTQALDDSIADLPLTGQQTPPAEEPAAPAEPAAPSGEEEPAADQSKPDGEGQPSDQQPKDGAETAPTDQAQPDNNAQQPADQQDVTPEERQRLAAQAFRQRQQARSQFADAIDQNYGPKTEEDFVNEGLDPAQAQVEALRAEMQYKEQRTQIAELNAGLQSDAVNVMHDMPVFDPNSKSFDEAFTSQVESLYKTAARVQADENGLVLNAEVPLYDFYKQMYDVYSRGNTTGALSQAQANAAMTAAAEEPGGSSSTNKGPLTPSDELAEMEARLGDVVIAG